MQQARKVFIATLAAAGGLAMAPAGPARAHPHVWVSVEATIVYEHGSIVGLRQKWTFDDFYSEMAIQGLDTNNDGVYDRNELAELAKLNAEGLAYFKYFTYPMLGTQQLEFDTLKEYWLEYAEAEVTPGPAAVFGPSGTSDSPPASAPAEKEKPGFWAGLWEQLRRALFGGSGSASAAPAKPKLLSMHLLLPLKAPVLAETQGFTFSVSDPSFYIWFEFVKNNPVRLSGAPEGCKVRFGAPEKDAAELQNLSEAFFAQLGGANVGSSVAKSVTVDCPK